MGVPRLRAAVDFVHRGCHAGHVSKQRGSARLGHWSNLLTHGCHHDGRHKCEYLACEPWPPWYLMSCRKDVLATEYISGTDIRVGASKVSTNRNVEVQNEVLESRQKFGGSQTIQRSRGVLVVFAMAFPNKPASTDQSFLVE